MSSVLARLASEGRLQDPRSVILKLILLGPPGAGKGTQAARIAAELGLSRMSSGDLFRDHQERNTDLGKLARSYMERGVLVPDDVTIKMVMQWIEDNEGPDGVLLDGFPRTLAQAEALDEALAGRGGIDGAVNIKVPIDEVVRRLAGRVVCRNCQTPYDREFSPPKEPGVCDRCGGELYQRDDDRPEAVKKRIEVYFEETEPLIEYYRQAGVLKEVEGEGPVEEVTRRLLESVS